MTTPTCPKCGSTMTIDPTCTTTIAVAEPYHLRHTPITQRVVPARVALCDGCEHVGTPEDWRHEVTVKFTPVTGVTSKIADVELHFTEGPLAGLKLIGFALYRSKHGFSITFPARQYAVNGERRSFALLRPATSDGAGVDNLRAAIVGAWEKENPR